MLKLIAELRQTINDRFKLFRTTQVIIACFCILIPLFFRISDTDIYSKKPIGCADKLDLVSVSSGSSAFLSNHDCQVVLADTVFVINRDLLGFRPTLSEYVYGTGGYIFGMLNCMAAMMFIFNGVVFFDTARILLLDRFWSFLNIVIGLSLFGVILTPTHDLPILHLIFTIIFFGGNIYILGFHPNPTESRKSKITRKIVAVLLVAIMVFSLISDHISILMAEWISLAAIAVHLIIAMTYSRKFLKAKMSVGEKKLVK